jgi:sec-independent protein translocase protein TatA
MGIGFRELLIILVIALILFGAKKLRNVGSDLGAAVRGFESWAKATTSRPRQRPTAATREGKDADQRGRRLRRHREIDTTMLRWLHEIVLIRIALLFGPPACRSWQPTSGVGRRADGAAAAQPARAGSPVRSAEGLAEVLAHDPYAATAIDTATAARCSGGTAGRDGQDR